MSDWLDHVEPSSCDEGDAAALADYRSELDRQAFEHDSDAVATRRRKRRGPHLSVFQVALMLRGMLRPRLAFLLAVAELRETFVTTTTTVTSDQVPVDVESPTVAELRAHALLTAAPPSAPAFASFAGAAAA